MFLILTCYCDKLFLQLSQYQYYSVGLLSNYDKFYEHQKVILGPKKKLAREQKKLEKKMKGIWTIDYFIKKKRNLFCLLFHLKWIGIQVENG